MFALGAAASCGAESSVEPEVEPTDVQVGTTTQPLISGPEWVKSGTLKSTYDPGTADGWFFNDHTYVKDEVTGVWHLFGIWDDNPFVVEESDQFGHATSPNLITNWTKVTSPSPYALTVLNEPGCSGLAKARCYAESHLWAPHVTKRQADGKYYMFYSGGNAKTDSSGNPIRTQEEINLATATSLDGLWTRDPGGPLFLDGYEARDPMVLELGPNSWVMYYTATQDPYSTTSKHIVAYRTSSDLINWSARATAFTDPGPGGTDAGGTESPYVVKRVISGTTYYYLFLGPQPYEFPYIPPNYPGTNVYVSTDWKSFSPAKQVAHLGVHAAEVVQDGANYAVSDAGWAKDFVYLYNLDFMNTPVKGSTLYALTAAKDKILKFNTATNSWSQIGNASTSLVGGGLGLFSLESGSLYRYDTGVRTLVSSTGSGYAANANALYRKDAGGVSKWNGSGDSWTDIGTAATKLYAGASELFASNPIDGGIYHYNGTPDDWTRIGNGADSWTVNANGAFGTSFWGLYTWSGTNDYWIHVGDTTSNLISGGDKVYATDSTGSLKVWSNVNASNKASQWSKVANSATAFAACDDMLYALRGNIVYKQPQGGAFAGTALPMNGYSVGTIVCGK